MAGSVRGGSIKGDNDNDFDMDDDYYYNDDQMASPPKYAINHSRRQSNHIG